jgi:hypothetical protein
MEWTTRIISKNLDDATFTVVVEFSCELTTFQKTFETNVPQADGWVQSNIDNAIDYANSLVSLYDSVEVQEIAEI